MARSMKTTRQVNPTAKASGRESLKRKAAAVFGVLDSLLGAERLARRADKVGAKVLMHSRQLGRRVLALQRLVYDDGSLAAVPKEAQIPAILEDLQERIAEDRKSTRLNSSHSQISYAVFCLKKKKT